MTQTDTIHVQRIAAFSDGNQGGNPAGVVILQAHPSAKQMQAVATEVGYSETVFVAPLGEGWKVRYFSPKKEVDFCGHATIALGATLARQFGDGTYSLSLNKAKITVDGRTKDGTASATLVSPPTRSRPVDQELLHETYSLFALTKEDVSQRLPPAIAHAGNDHLVIALNSRARLAKMSYEMEPGAVFMTKYGLTTINLLYVEAPALFHSRNAFAIGGVLEDPATGAAAAALAGYLRDINWPHGGSIEVIQGEDMGARSILHAEITAVGEGIRIEGSTRVLEMPCQQLGDGQLTSPIV